MPFEKYSRIPTRNFATIYSDPDQNKMARKKVEVLLNGIKTVDTKLIACKAIISQNYASDFTGACSHLPAQVARFHEGAHMDIKRYKRRIPKVSCGVRGRGGVRGCDSWMHGGRDGDEGGGRDKRGGRSGGISQTVINGVDVLNPTRHFTANEWTRLGWNSG